MVLLGLFVRLAGMHSKFVWLQVNVKNLKDRDLWACGWLQKVDLQELSTGSRQICKVCQGTGLVDSSL